MTLETRTLPNDGKRLFCEFATLYQDRFPHTSDEEAEQFAFMCLSVYAAAMGSKEASDHFIRRAKEVNPGSVPL